MFLIKIYIKESYINYYHTIIQMCGQYCILALYDLWRHLHLWVGVWVDGWFSGSMGGVRSYYLISNKS